MRDIQTDFVHIAKRLEYSDASLQGTCIKPGACNALQYVNDQHYLEGDNSPRFVPSQTIELPT